MLDENEGADEDETRWTLMCHDDVCLSDEQKKFAAGFFIFYSRLGGWLPVGQQHSVYILGLSWPRLCDGLTAGVLVFIFHG
jgi:hypothetical protein